MHTRRHPRSRVHALILSGVLGVLAPGCARALAKNAPDTPPLDAPAPPPRTVETVEPEPPKPISLPAEPARRAPSRPPARPAASPRADAGADAPRVEAPPVEVARPSDDPSRPATTLQTTPAGAEGEVERSIRGLLAKAASDLGRVDYRILNADARTQYDTAKRFGQQAEESIRTRNLVFARNLAEKAAALAAQLAGR